MKNRTLTDIAILMIFSFILLMSGTYTIGDYLIAFTIPAILYLFVRRYFFKRSYIKSLLSNLESIGVDKDGCNNAKKEFNNKYSVVQELYDGYYAVFVSMTVFYTYHKLFMLNEESGSTYINFGLYKNMLIEGNIQKLFEHTDALYAIIGFVLGTILSLLVEKLTKNHLSLINDKIFKSYKKEVEKNRITSQDKALAIYS